MPKVVPVGNYAAGHTSPVVVVFGQSTCLVCARRYKPTKWAPLSWDTPTEKALTSSVPQAYMPEVVHVRQCTAVIPVWTNAPPVAGATHTPPGNDASAGQLAAIGRQRDAGQAPLALEALGPAQAKVGSESPTAPTASSHTHRQVLPPSRVTTMP